MLSEPDISKWNLLTQISSQSLSPPPADKQCKSNENSPVMARRKRNNSGSSSSSTSSGVSSGSDTSSVPKNFLFSLPRSQFAGLPIGCRSPRLRKSRGGVSRRPSPPKSPSNRSAHAGCIIRVSIDGQTVNQLSPKIRASINLFKFLIMKVSLSELVIPDNANVYYALNSSIRIFAVQTQEKGR
ncbi:unnamed protein product [Pocillopora meandrina]|uniref:Uncharacterized protein n=1 Tax=Pocillopora meandrina TaxID=46732 RepID=A0AAU9VTA8_9CNID|nr:unnamed protein product [Pocillopora meandrina]